MSRDELAELTAKITVHPAFHLAARHYVAEYVEWRERLGLLNKVVANAARLRVLENLVNLHFLRKAGESGVQASFERLVELSGADDVRARAVRTVLRLAEVAGLIAVAGDAHDRRLRVYRPTDALIGYARKQTLIALRPLDAMYPQLRVCERIVADPDFYGVIAARLSRAFSARRLRRPSGAVPIRDLMRQEGAMPILSLVVAGHYGGRDVPPAPELSRRFFVSQTQARIVLNRAKTRGFMRMRPRGRLLDAEPLAQALFEAHARYLSYALIWVFDGEPTRAV